MQTLHTLFRLLVAGLLFLAGSASALDDAARADEAAVSAAAYEVVADATDSPDVAGAGIPLSVTAPDRKARISVSLQPGTGRVLHHLHHHIQSPRAPPVHC